MSELKAYHCNEWHNEYTEFYIKSEADKVIAEKDAEIERLRGESCKLTDGCLRLKQCRREKANIADKLCHSDRKRCLDNAWWCRNSSNSYAWSASNLRGWKIAVYYDKKAELYRMWRKIWLALAEEPTWAKFLQLIHKETK